VGGQVGGQDLGEIAPLGDEDHDERSCDHPPVRAHFLLDEAGFVPLAFDVGIDGAGEEHERHDNVHHLPRQDGEQSCADGRCDHRMDEEGARRSQPHCARPAPRSHDKGGEHGLVR